MKKIKKLIRTRYLTIIALFLVILALSLVTNNYIKETTMIYNHSFKDIRGVFFEIISYQSGTLIFIIPLSLTLLIVDNWYNKFKNGNIKHYLLRMSYKDFKKKLFKSIMKISILYPLILFALLLISIILTKGQNDFSSVNIYSGYYNIWAYHNFFLYILGLTILLYIQGLLTSSFTLIYLNKVKNKTLTIIFSYLTWLIVLVALHVIPYMIINILFNYQINSNYLNFYVLQVYFNTNDNYFIYLLCLFIFTIILLGINFLIIYRTKEKVVLDNEKEMEAK